MTSLEKNGVNEECLDKKQNSFENKTFFTRIKLQVVLCDLVGRLARLYFIVWT